MNVRDITISLFLALVFTPVLLLTVSISRAQVMQSTSYRIQEDSVNFGGGFSSSTSYTLESSGGEVATGESGSTNFNIKAGYQQMTSTYLAMSAPGAVTMTPSLSGITGGESNGSTTVTVTTDNAAGYTIQIRSEQSPALVSGGDFIADYVPIGDPDYTFTTGLSGAYFGYSPAGIDVAQRFLDDGAGLCNTDTQENYLTCWDGLSTTDSTIVYRTSANTPSGSTTTINFRVGVGSSTLVPSGTYTATTTLTALAL